MVGTLYTNWSLHLMFNVIFRLWLGLHLVITCISLIILTSWMSTLVPYLQLQTPKHTHFIIRDQFSLEGYNTPVPKVPLKSFICSMGASMTFWTAMFYVHNEGGFIYRFGCYRPAFWEYSEPAPLVHFHVEVKDWEGLDDST